MASKKELEQLDLTRLAVLCQKVADDSSVEDPTAGKSWQLKRKWVVLVARETPPPLDFNTQAQIRKKRC
jgi:hypothetical protein